MLPPNKLRGGEDITKLRDWFNHLLDYTKSINVRGDLRTIKVTDSPRGKTLAIIDKETGINTPGESGRGGDTYMGMFKCIQITNSEDDTIQQVQIVDPNNYTENNGIKTYHNAGIAVISQRNFIINASDILQITEDCSIVLTGEYDEANSTLPLAFEVIAELTPNLGVTNKFTQLIARVTWNSDSSKIKSIIQEQHGPIVGEIYKVC